MATENRENQRGIVIPTGKEKTVGAVEEAMNRKALKDIGNMINLCVIDEKPVHHLVDKHFGAQRLANAQTTAITKKFQEHVAIPSDVLTPRSKIACEIKDIDADDANNEFLMSKYVKDLYKFYKLQENLNRPLNYMSSQVEINANMRAIVVDWLIVVHYEFELMPETLFLTIFIIDRYLSV